MVIQADGAELGVAMIIRVARAAGAYLLVKTEAAAMVVKTIGAAVAC